LLLCFFVITKSKTSYIGYYFFFFKQKTAYEITRRDWSSDVCSSDLRTTDGGKTWSPARIIFDPGTQNQTIAKDRKSVVQGKSVPCCVDLGGRSVIKKKRSESHISDKASLCSNAAYVSGP